MPILVLGIAHLKIFYRNFLCLKVFELKLRLSRYNLFFWPMANKRWSEHGFHWYMACHALERHGGAIWVKLDEKPCGKENFERNWKMTVYGWLKVKLLYYISIKSAFHCFLQLGTAFFVTSGFLESKAVSVGQISKIRK